MTIGRALFSFSGRMKRSDYWLKGALPLLPIGIFNNVLMWGIGTDEAMGIAMVIGLICLWPSFALIVKRLHDRNRTAWFILILLIPYVGAIWLLIEVFFLRGTIGPNRFGNDPLQVPAA